MDIVLAAVADGLDEGFCPVSVLRKLSVSVIVGSPATPQRPKPELRMVEPLLISSTASSAEAYTFDLGRVADALKRIVDVVKVRRERAVCWSCSWTATKAVQRGSARGRNGLSIATGGMSSALNYVLLKMPNIAIRCRDNKCRIELALA